MRRSYPIITVTGLLALLLGCTDASAPAAPPAATQVGTMTVTAQSLTLQQQLPGRTSAYQVAEVRPQVNGLIMERLFEEGSQVSAGQPLYRLDDRRYQAELDSARAQLQRSQATLESNRLRAERFESLLQHRAVSQQEVDEANATLAENRAQVAAAKASLQQAQINLDYATISAPISGRIGRSSVTAGALVSANQAQSLATIRQLDPIYVDLSQSNTEMMALRRAFAEGRLAETDQGEAAVSLILEDGSRYAEQGRLQFSEFAVDSSTGTVTLRALFANPDHSLLPGVFVRAELPEGVRDNAILVPQKAISRDPTGNAFAMVVQADDTVQRTPVSAQRSVGNQWLIDSGLAAGDQLVVDGLQKIRPGMAVSAVPVDQQQHAQDSSPQGPPQASAERAEQTSGQAG